MPAPPVLSRDRSRSGANSSTPGAKTGSLTELNTGTGALITTLPV
jgi:hypothetical protein